MHKRRGEAVGQILSIEAALYHAAHDFPGGVPAVAAALGRNAGTLQNKLNIGTAEPAPTLRDFRDILNLTRDERILHAVSAPVGYVPILLGHFAQSSDMELLDIVNRIVQRVGQTTGDLSTSLADGRISTRERDEIAGDIYRAIQVLQELGARVDAMAQPDIERTKPALVGRGGGQ